MLVDIISWYVPLAEAGGLVDHWPNGQTPPYGTQEHQQNQWIQSCFCEIVWAMTDTEKEAISQKQCQKRGTQKQPIQV
jgi:hypothetical protein